MAEQTGQISVQLGQTVMCLHPPLKFYTTPTQNGRWRLMHQDNTVLSLKAKLRSRKEMNDLCTYINNLLADIEEQRNDTAQSTRDTD